MCADNIFDFASQRSGKDNFKKKKPFSKPGPPAPASALPISSNSSPSEPLSTEPPLAEPLSVEPSLSEPASLPAEVSSSSSTPKLNTNFSDPEIKMAFEKAIEINQMIKKKGKVIDQFLEEKQFSADILEDPANFSSLVWKDMQRCKTELENTLWRGVGEKYKKQLNEQEISKKSRKRLRKTIGGRKGWISMD